MSTCPVNAVTTTAISDAPSSTPPWRSSPPRAPSPSACVTSPAGPVCRTPRPPTTSAIEGYEILADSMQEALAATPIPLPEIGVRYVKFALEHPAHFEVMYRPELYHRDDPELLAAKQWARRTLRAGIVTLPHGRRGEAAEFGVIAAWSLAHGFAVLARSGNLAEDLGEASPLSVFRRIAQRTIPAVDPVSEADGSTTRP